MEDWTIGIISGFLASTLFSLITYLIGSNMTIGIKYKYNIILSSLKNNIFINQKYKYITIIPEIDDAVLMIKKLDFIKYKKYIITMLLCIKSLVIKGQGNSDSICHDIIISIALLINRNLLRFSEEDIDNIIDVFKENIGFGDLRYNYTWANISTFKNEDELRKFIAEYNEGITE